MGQQIGMGHMGHESVPMINMHPETVEAISIVLEGLKIRWVMCCWNSDDSWHFFLYFSFYFIRTRYCVIGKELFNLKLAYV